MRTEASQPISPGTPELGEPGDLVGHDRGLSGQDGPTRLGAEDAATGAPFLGLEAEAGLAVEVWRIVEELAETVALCGVRLDGPSVDDGRGL